MRKLIWLGAGTLLAMLGVACGDEVTTVDDDDAISVGVGAGDVGGGSGDGGGVVGKPEVDTARAPTEYTVAVAFTGGLPDWASDVGRYALGGGGGELAIESLSADAATGEVMLTTARQKLGVDYTLTIVTDEGDETRTFPSADTASFWASDFSSPNFDDVKVEAARAVVGTHGVIYLELGYEGTSGVADAIKRFDESIYPIETDLFAKPDDVDDNGKIVLLGLDGGNAYGGYFGPINALPDEMTFSQWGRHSNEMEMVYINVRMGDFDHDVVLPHEFEHLLYAAHHGFLTADWPYHNEGLAECAVRAVNGAHSYALEYLVADPSGGVARGPSLVHWDYGNYDNYVLAYLFWSYVAGQLDGTTTYAELFDVDGDPAAIQTYLQSKLGLDFAEVQLRSLAAAHAQQATGPAGFEGFITLPGNAPLAPSGSLDLAPFAGLLLSPGVATSMNPPTGAGPNLIYAGVNAAGAIDVTAPYDVAGGVLVALNARFDVNDATAEPVGSPVSAFAPGGHAHETVDLERFIRASRLHPPPFNPARLDRMRAWQRSVGLVP